MTTPLASQPATADQPSSCPRRNDAAGDEVRPFTPGRGVTASWTQYLPEGIPSEAALRLLDGVLALPLVFFRLDTEGTFKDLVGDTERRLGVPAEEFLGKPATALVPETEGFATRTINGATQWAEMSGVLDGAPWTSLTFATPLDDGEGIIGVALGITDWKRAEARLEASERRYRNLADSAPVGIIHAGTDGEVLYLNPTMRRLAGIESEEVTGEAWLDIIHPGDRDRVAEEWSEMVARGEAQQFLYRISGTDGGIRWIMGNVVPDRDPDGGLESFIGTVVDISDRIQAEEKLARAVAERTAELSCANAELERANGELQAFAGTVSHDLRAPLRSVSAFLHLANDEQGESMSPDLRQQLDRALASTKRMEHLIHGLLGLARTERTELQRREVNLSELAAEVVAELRDGNPERAVAVEIAAGLDARGDSDFLADLLENLLSNAWKFTGRTPDPAIEFSCEVHDGETVYFVRDNGAGFDSSIGSDVFAPFNRVHDSRDFEGSGIGLASARRIVTLHGGRIWAESRPGAGATFYFTLA
jgi:PAS domain S-box-containing protein